MPLEFPPLKRLALLLFLIVPIAAWFAVKPIRVVYPKAEGMSCVSAVVCIEELEQAQEAQALYTEAIEFVSAQLGPMRKPPRMSFCSTDACAKKFGLGERAAVTIGTFGSVIGPRAWTPYLVRHEMIHALLGEQLGVLKLLRMPPWFVEGMAYAMSADLREPLAAPFENYRSAFVAWSKGIDMRMVWHEAKRL